MDLVLKPTAQKWPSRYYALKMFTYVFEASGHIQIEINFMSKGCNITPRTSISSNNGLIQPFPRSVYAEIDKNSRNEVPMDVRGVTLQCLVAHMSFSVESYPLRIMSDGNFGNKFSNSYTIIRQEFRSAWCGILAIISGYVPVQQGRSMEWSAYSKTENLLDFMGLSDRKRFTKKYTGILSVYWLP